MLADIAIFLAAAVIAVSLFKRLGLGSVLGYLAAGVAIGPSGFWLIYEVEATMHFAEFGVVLLLFLIGLELQPRRLWRMRRAVFVTGGAQVGVTGAAIALVGVLLGLSVPVALVAGFGLAMSSTAFATQILGERNELGRPHGKSAFGILLFQDVAAMPLLAVIPALGHNASKQETSGTQFMVAISVIAALVVGGRIFLRPAFRFVAKARSHELSSAFALLVVIGTSIVMERVGMSMALGAFIAGVLLADSEYRHELEANIEPFKGLLLGLFFMAVGMATDLRVLYAHPATVVVLVIALVTIKFVILFVLGRASKLSRYSSLSLAIAVSQGGEFAFVIFGVGQKANVLSQYISDLLVVVVTLSMVATPFLFIARDRLLDYLSKHGKKREFDDIQDDGSKVIIAGFGRFGQIVARVLRLKRIPFTALDASATHVDFVRKFGNKIYYGDASRVDLLRAAGASHAQLFVLAIDDFDASMRTLKAVQSHFPNLRIVARARNRQHAYALLGAGVEIVIRETLAASLDAARIALEELGFPSSDARETVRRFGEYDEKMVRESYQMRNDEKALIEASKRYSQELERIFEQDVQAEAN